MRIGIDARPLLCGGAGEYLRTLIDSLFKIDRTNRYTLFVSDDVIDKDLLGGLDQNDIEIVNVRVNSLTLRHHALFPIHCRKRGLDLYHYPYFDMPLVNFSKSVATIYDLYPLTVPGYCSSLKKIYFSALTRHTLKRSAKVIAISQSTKDDIVKYFDIEPEKISVIYPAIDPFYKQLTVTELKKEIKTKYGIRNRFILYVGNAKKHKNLMRLAKAFSGLKKDLLAEYQLVFVGRTDKDYLELSRVTNKMDLSKNVIFTGRIPKEDLLQLYNLTDLLMLVSIYEGFGLPLIEAMACSAPVMASNVTAMPEVVGDAGILANPYDVGDMAEKMETILSDKALRNMMKKKSVERVKNFDWKRAAKETLKVYEEAVERL